MNGRSWVVLFVAAATLIGWLAVAPAPSAAGADGRGASVATRATAGCTSLPSPQDTYTNPVLPCDAPDPDVVVSGTEFYAFTTGGSYGHIQLFASPNLTSWTPEPWPGPLQTEPAWATPGHEWAPSVVELGGRWLMYYATQSTARGVECLSVATASSVTGPYSDNSSGPLECQTGTDPRSGEPYGGDIDPDVFVAPSGAAYLLWKSNDGSSPAPAYIWAQPLAPDGLSVAPGTAPTILLPQNQSWELTMENPDLVFVGGTYYLFFAGGQWNNGTYAEGYAICASPLGPCVQPGDHPILASAGQVVGPGGGTAFEDGFGQWWMAYQAWTAGAVGYQNGGERSMRIDPLCFPGGVPVVLGPTTSPQPLTQHCPTTAPNGYRLAAADGGVFAYGTSFDGSMGGQGTDGSVVGIATDVATGGYWIVTSQGAVYGFSAPVLGSVAGWPLAAPIVGMAPTADGRGYWLVAADGGVFAFGDAPFFGSMGGRRLAAPIVGIAPDPLTGGYWLVAADGGVFSFGAPFLGSMGGQRLAAPVVGIAPAGFGAGYWLVAADGGVFTFGAADFAGSAGGIRLAAPVVGLAVG